MSDKPIIFSGPMVNAMIAGRKTQTRRVLKTQPDPAFQIGGAEFVHQIEAPPRYAPGDRLWVREALIGASGYDGQPPSQWGNKPIWYCADGEPDRAKWWHLSDLERSPIHMPRWASRLTLTVTDVRVQRLQNISEADARAEGAGLYVPGHGFITDSELQADPGYSNFLAPRMGFEAVWSEIHGPDAWDTNPWVLALTFTVHHGNIDQMVVA